MDLLYTSQQFEGGSFVYVYGLYGVSGSQSVVTTNAASGHNSLVCVTTDDVAALPSVFSEAEASTTNPSVSTRVFYTTTSDLIIGFSKPGLGITMSAGAGTSVVINNTASHAAWTNSVGVSGGYWTLHVSGTGSGQLNLISFALQPYAATGTLAYMVSQSQNQFSVTTDPPLASFVGWSASNFYDLFLGSGLAVLFYLRGWLVAMIMIGAIIYFVYRFFIFFKSH